MNSAWSAERRRENIEAYGEQTIITKAIEEMAELTQQLCKYSTGDRRFPSIAEELADVYITIDQVTIIMETQHPAFRAELNQAIAAKIQRQLQRLAERRKG